jgi:hypothetical protein
MLSEDGAHLLNRRSVNFVSDAKMGATLRHYPPSHRLGCLLGSAGLEDHEENALLITKSLLRSR